MARSHELARCRARYILALEGADRSHFSRELAKRVRRVLAYVTVVVLEREQIERLIDQARTAARESRAE